MELIENTASRCRIAFRGACVTTVKNLYRLGHRNLELILADLSRSLSRHLTEYSWVGNRHCDESATNRREQHAYDIYSLLLESSSLHRECSPGSLGNPKREARLQQEDPTYRRKIFHGRKDCIDFLATVDGFFQLPQNDCSTGSGALIPGANKRSRFSRDCRASHEVLRELLFDALKDGRWSGTFFITFDGHLGIGPESTQPGDQIVVLDGARSPFVLRALENSTDYALLGDSFVLGLMHGEVREMDARGQLESRQIVIR